MITSREVAAGLAVRVTNKIAGLTPPVFSVVIPVYDRTTELREAIESILSQSFRNFELLLVCDGSPSETVRVVESYIQHPQVRAFYFENNSGNPCRGRNKGIAMARGRYVAFLDSDDRASPQRLERSLYFLIAKNVDGVGGAIRYITGGEKYRGIDDGQIGFTSEECTFDHLLKGNRLSICTVAVSKGLLLKYGGFRKEMRYREDHELWLRLAYHGCSFYNSPEVFADYRLHESNAELRYLHNDAHWYEMVMLHYDREFSWGDRK